MTRVVSTYLDEYADQLTRAMGSVDRNCFAMATHVLEQAYLSSNKVFVCGNGGSASISEHFCCDHFKGVATDTSFLPKVESLTGPSSLLTAIANDMGYDNVFSYQLGIKAGVNDVLVAISSSGNSPNIIKAIETAKKKLMSVITLTGFDGGKAKQHGINLHVDSYNYGIIEDCHQSIMHAMSQKIRLANLNKDINNVRL